MRIVVDLNRCQGYGQCVFLAPSVFELHGEEALMYDPGPDEAQRLPVVRAAAACPVQAIRVDGPDDGEHEPADGAFAHEWSRRHRRRVTGRAARRGELCAKRDSGGG